MTKKEAKLHEAIMLIRAAQIASDEAKSYYGCRKGQSMVNKYYRIKDVAVQKAIKLICKYHFNELHFFVGHDDEGRMAGIVYFQYRANGNYGRMNTWQISFHTPNYSLVESFYRRDKTIRWDKYSSRESSEYLAEMYSVETTANNFVFG